MMRLGTLCIAVLVGATGCARGFGDARDLAVSSDAAAQAVVSSTLAALARGDERPALDRFCDTSPAGRARARDVLAPALRRGDLAVLRVEPAWVGAEPFFFVEVGAADGSWRHGLGVRVRDGCLDRAVGAGAPRPVDGTVFDL